MIVFNAEYFDLYSTFTQDKLHKKSSFYMKSNGSFIQLTNESSSHCEIRGAGYGASQYIDSNGVFRLLFDSTNSDLMISHVNSLKSLKNLPTKIDGALNLTNCPNLLFDIPYIECNILDITMCKNISDLSHVVFKDLLRVNITKQQQAIDFNIVPQLVCDEAFVVINSCFIDHNIKKTNNTIKNLHLKNVMGIENFYNLSTALRKICIIDNTYSSFHDFKIFKSFDGIETYDDLKILVLENCGTPLKNMLKVLSSKSLEFVRVQTSHSSFDLLSKYIFHENKSEYSMDLMLDLIEYDLEEYA